MLGPSGVSIGQRRVGAEERIDYARNGLGVDKVDGGEHLIVAHIHALTDGAGHTCQTYTELVIELLADSAHTAVAQVVDIVDISLGVDKLDKILDNLDDILLRQNLNIHRSGQTQFLVDALAAHLTKVITLLREEKVCDYLACTRVIRRLCVAQLPVDILYGLLLRVRCIFLKSVEDNRII